MSPKRSQPTAQLSRATPNAFGGAAAVACITALAFIPTLRNGFVNFDDDRLLLHNPYLRLPPGETLRWILSTTFLGHYQPLTWLSLWLDYVAAGVSPIAYHTDSLVWHCAAAALLYIIVVELLRRTAAGRMADRQYLSACAAAGALFWSVHPLRVESVAWVSERRDPVSIVFLLLAFYAYLRAAAALGVRRHAARWRLISYAGLTLSVLAKAWGMTFFVTLVAVDFFPLQRLPIAIEAVTDRRYRRVWTEKIPYAVIGAAAGAGAWLAQRVQPDTMLSASQWSWTDRLLQAAYGLCFYVAKTAWPTSLAAMYELPTRSPGRSPIFAVCLVTVIVAARFTARFARRLPALLAGSIVYVATVAPVLGFAQSGPQLVADRYAYVCSVAISALLAGGLLVLPARRRRRTAAAVGGGLLALGALTWQQTEVWRDSTTLWSHAIESGHPSYVAYLNYGQAVRADGRLDEAIRNYQEALAIRPEAGNAWYNLANALKTAGRLDEAERAYRTAIDRLTWKVDAQVNLGNLYFTRRQLPAAIREYRAATETLAHVAPAEFSPEPYLYLGIALSDSGDAAGARDALAIAVPYPATRARAEAELQRLATPR
jgi:protein O-mannosyl-transferase